MITSVVFKNVIFFCRHPTEFTCLARIYQSMLNAVSIYRLDAPLSPEFQLREVYPELLDAVADCISYEVIEVGLELGFKFEEILRFRMKYSDPLQTNREMLREWQRRNKPEGKATIAWLTHCLLNTRSDIGTLIEHEERAFQESRQTPEKKRCSIA